MLSVNSKAPDLEIETHLGYQGPLSGLWREGPLVLFFYPKDDTPTCTKQACTLQSSLAEFGNFDANVLGSSLGNAASHRAFAAKHQLEFPLVCDVRGTLARAFEAYRSLLRISKRITYVIGKDGVILGAVHSEFKVGAHLDMIRKTLSSTAA